jgi:hypothetical protein
LALAHSIANGGSGSSTPRPFLIPVTALEIGPILSIVLIIGVVHLFEAPRRKQNGWIALGFLIFLVVMLVTGGKAYYPAAFYPALLAAGAAPVIDWARRRAWRRILNAGLIVISIIITVCLTLPVFPLGSTGFQIGMRPNPDMGETVGWNGYVRTVETVASSIPASEQSHTIVLASNYGEAGALYLARNAANSSATLPPVYSGHNAFWYWGPPPKSATDAIVVGDFSASQLHAWFSSCTLRARLHSPRGVDNSEAEASVRWCTGRTQSWARLWPLVKRLG